MERRRFIKVVSASSVIVLIPVIGCSSSSQSIEILAKPLKLSKIMGEEEIINIGNQYLKMFPDESKIEVLEKVLTKNLIKPNQEESDKYVIEESFISSKVIKNFKDNQIITIDGWILSLTEARQCALKSLI